MEYLDLELVSEPKQNKPKIRTRIKQNLIPVAEVDQGIILERIADIEIEIKTRKVRECKPKSPRPVKIPKPEPEPTKVIFIKGPIILDFEEN